MKSALQPSQEVPYLGLHLDSHAMIARLSEERAEALLRLLTKRVRFVASVPVEERHVAPRDEVGQLIRSCTWGCCT
eukprot:superscaffoldBa00003321_g16657